MSKSEQAKAAGWRIECLGDQWEGLFNWLLWTPNDDGCIQTKYPLASEAEAWRYFFGFVKGLQYAVGMWQPAPSAPSAPAPTGAEALDWNDPAIENTVEYWKKIAADNLELAATNARLLENAQHELEQVRGELAAAREALKSAGEWIAGATVSQEPGWNGSTQHVLNVITDALKASTLVSGGGEGAG